MDQPGPDTAEIYQALGELNFINRLLGGHRVTLSGIHRLLSGNRRPYRIIDFGCGGGGTLRAIHEWSRSNEYQVELTGLDVMPEAIDYSRRLLGDVEYLHLVRTDFRDFAPAENAYDIALCSLFMHHFYDQDLDLLLETMQRSAALGIVINDLHRHVLAERSIRLLTRLFSKSRLVQYDGPLSVRKGFSRRDLEGIFRRVNFTGYTIRWRWAFRYLIVVPNGKHSEEGGNAQPL